MASLRADAKDFSPTEGTLSFTIRDCPSKVPCRFFAKGFCRNGASCRFSHVNEKSSVLGINVDEISAQISQPPSSPNTRNISGSTVCFGTTVEVLSVKFPSDFSAIQIPQLPLSASPDSIHQLLERAGFKVRITDIRVKSTDGFAIAEVRTEDPSFAENAIRNLSGAVFMRTRINVRRLQTGIERGMLTNRLQNTALTCSWYKASRVAWAQYTSSSEAEKAATTMNGITFMGRKLECKVQPGTAMVKGAIYSVQIGNLPTIVSQDALQGAFGHPRKVVLGRPSWDKPDKDAPNYIKSLLSQSGSLESFEASPAVHATRGRAIARFKSAEDARKVARDLGGTKLPEMGRSKLFLTPLVVVKFNVMTDMYEAIRKDLDDLRPQIWNEGHVNLKIYSPVDPSSQRFTTLRLSGEDVKSVAKAKGQVEVTLGGSLAVVSGDTTALWSEFFATPEGLQFLRELRKAHGVFLCRDLRKRQITQYGPAEGKQKVQEALRQKIEALSAQTHVIPLDPEWLRSALQGGFRSIRSVLGTSARFDVMRKTLTIHGDLTARRAAESILRNPGLNATAPEFQPDEEDKECSVCYTEATDPYRTPCEHYYCRDCFIHQITSANRLENFPITCIGSQGNCTKPLPFTELRRVLSTSDFESLLQAAFVAHIRSKPQEYQYCPTADCDQLYRTSGSENGAAFDCPNCLNSICTSCKVVYHEGSTCEEYRDLTSEGAIAFQRWKEKNHVKPCPKCNTPIEKESGCNHMTCQVCQTHICWFCMECFGSGAECYRHMNAVHADFFGVGVPSVFCGSWWSAGRAHPVIVIPINGSG